MSIVALKRKGQQLHTLSGKSGSSSLVVRGPSSNESALTIGGGFTLHGKQRNIGYIGKNSLNSIGGTRMKPGTATWKGNGGCCNEYVVNSSPNNQCCVKNEGVKPSVLNTKGMLARKYRWKKSEIADNEFTDQGFEVPEYKQLENTFNRWVSNNSNSYNEKNTSHQYTENLARASANCNHERPPVVDAGIRQGCLGNQCYHINGRYVAPTPYSKELNLAASSDRAIKSAIARRASVFAKGYNRPYPNAPTGNQCQNPRIQPTDPRVLRNYYYDQNSTCETN